VHQYCAGCHSTSIPTTQREGAPDIVNLETYTGVLRWSGHLLNTAGAEPPTMPPGGGTTAEERALLAEWLACEVLPDAARVEELPL